MASFNEIPHPPINVWQLGYTFLWSATTANGIANAAANGSRFFESSFLRTSAMLFPASYLINFLTNPFRPHEGLFTNDISTLEKVCRVGADLAGVAAGIGLAQTVISPNHWEWSQGGEDDAMEAFLFVVYYLGEYGANLVASRGLRNQMSEHDQQGGIMSVFSLGGRGDEYTQINNHTPDERVVNQMPEGNAGNGVMTTFSWDRLNNYLSLNNTPEENQRTIQMKKQIQALDDESEFRSNIFNRLFDCIQNDLELREAYQKVKKIDDILADPVLDLSDPVDDPLVEEWRVAQLKNDYWRKWITRFNLFIEQNPEFQEILRRKIPDIIGERPQIEYEVNIGAGPSEDNGRAKSD